MALGGFAPMPMRLGGSAELGVTAAQHARACADLVACSRVMPFAVLFYHVDATVPAAYVDEYYSMDRGGLITAPTVTRISAGLAEVEWATAYSNDYGEEATTNIIMAKATPHANVATFGNLTCVSTVLSPRKVRVYVETVGTGVGYDALDGVVVTFW